MNLPDIASAAPAETGRQTVEQMSWAELALTLGSVAFVFLIFGVLVVVAIVIAPKGTRAVPPPRTNPANSGRKAGRTGGQL